MNRIRLDDAEIRVGVQLELEAARLEGKLEMVRAMAQAHAQRLREKYGLDESYTLTDWLEGFVVHDPQLPAMGAGIEEKERELENGR